MGWLEDMFGMGTPGAASGGAAASAATDWQDRPLGPGGMTVRNSRDAREADINSGAARWAALVGSRPEYKENLGRMRDMSQGLNAQEMLAAREQMARGVQGQTQGAMRSLYSNQARSGIRGGMAGAQAARVQQQGMRDRQAAEQKLLLDNYALRRQGLQDYSQAVNRDISGELGTGMGYAGLGVADRTASQQAAAAQAAAAANNRGGGLMSWIFG
jgi:hypothetical protein